MNWKKDGFISIQHNNLRLLTANMMQQCHVMNEQGKKRVYKERIFQRDHGIFTPLVFLIKVVWEETKFLWEETKFYSRLAQLISEKRDLLQSISSNWIQTKVCFG